MAGGSGSVRLKRAPDYWEVRVHAGRDPDTGRKRYVSRTVRGGKRDAQRLLTELSAEIAKHGATKTITIDGLLVAHLEHLEARGRERRTVEGYGTIARGVAADPVFGATQLDRLTVKAVDDFYNRLRRRGLSPSTIQRYHSLLRSAVKQAMAWGWCATNPVVLATPPSVPRLGREIPTVAVVNQLLAEAAASRNPENHVAFRLAATTGARRGELCGLRWSNLRLDSGRVTIRAAIGAMHNGELFEKDPKSHQIRELIIDTATIELLKAHRETQRAFARGCGVELERAAYVLADLADDPTGLTPINPNRLTQAFKRLRQRVPGAEHLRLHDLRHWYASTQLDAGEPLPAVAARLGDHVETLAKVYAHKGHRGDDAAAALMGSLLDS